MVVLRGGGWSGGDGAGATRQRVQQGKGGLVLPAMMEAVGALQREVGGGSALQRGCGVVVVRCKRGRGAVVVRMEAGTRARGTSEWWGQ
jgi:hypothetical protein